MMVERDFAMAVAVSAFLELIVTTRYGLLHYDYLIRWTGLFIFLST